MYAEISTIDPATNCWFERRMIEVKDVQRIETEIGIGSTTLHMVYDVSAEVMRLLNRVYDLKLEEDNRNGEICFWSDARAFNPHTHTGRELALMIAGKKPLAAFSELAEVEETCDRLPKKYFEPFVKEGKIVKRTFIQNGKSGPLKWTLYAIAHETWRIDAYKALWNLAEKYGWSEGFERMEGFLLGYEVSIDDFFTRNI